MIVPPELDGANLTQGTARVAPAPGILKEFLYWALQSRLAREFWERSVGGATFKALNLEPLARTPCVHLPYDEQRRVATFLDREIAKIESIVDSRRRSMTLLQERQRTLVDGMVEGSRDTLAALGVDGRLTGWDRAKLVQYVEVQAGFPFSSDKYLGQSKGGIRLLRGANVGVGGTDWSDTVFWPSAEAAAFGRFSLRLDDLVLGMDRPWISSGLRLATIAECDLPALLVQRVARITPRDSRLDRSYLRWVLSSSQFKCEMELNLTGVSVPHISAEQILGFRLPVPDVGVQSAIGSTLDELDRGYRALRSKVLAQIDTLLERKRSLITAAVTGQIDVNTARGVRA